MGLIALAVPPCLSLGSVVMMCAPLGQAVHLNLPVSQPLTYAQSLKDGYGGVVSYRTAITAAQLRVFGPDNPTSVTCRGSSCVALATVDGFQYPASSSDHGRSWRNDGHWFAGAWADGAAFATRIQVLRPGVYVAWPQLTGVYLTTTSGRAWYVVATPGTPTRVTATGRSVTVFVREGAKRTAAFTSDDGGRTWVAVR